MSTIKIGIISLSSGHLGDAVRINQFVDVLKRMGFDIQLFNPYSELLPFKSSDRNTTRLTSLIPQAWQIASKFPGIRSFPIEKSAYNLLYFLLSKELLKLVGRKNLDLIQAETFFAADIALPIKQALSIPMVFDLHSGLFTNEIAKSINPSKKFLRYWHEKEKQILQKSDHIIVTSQVMKNELESGYGLKNVSLIPNGAVPWDGYRAPYDYPLRVIYSGLFAYWERVQDYIDAIKLIKDPNYEFFLMGEGYQRKELLKKINREGIPIRYLGCLPRMEFRRQMANMHIGIVPWSREDPFKFYSSTKTYEYLSMGLPVVCAEGGEWANVVRENNCGIIVPPEDASAIAEAIEMYKDRALWEKQSNNGTRFVLKHRSWEKLIEPISSVYQELKHSKG